MAVLAAPAPFLSYYHHEAIGIMICQSCEAACAPTGTDYCECCLDEMEWEERAQEEMAFYSQYCTTGDPVECDPSIGKFPPTNHTGPSLQSPPRASMKVIFSAIVLIIAIFAQICFILTIDEKTASAQTAPQLSDFYSVSWDQISISSVSSDARCLSSSRTTIRDLSWRANRLELVGGVLVCASIYVNNVASSLVYIAFKWPGYVYSTGDNCRAFFDSDGVGSSASRIIWGSTTLLTVSLCDGSVPGLFGILQLGVTPIVRADGRTVADFSIGSSSDVDPHSDAVRLYYNCTEDGEVFSPTRHSYVRVFSSRNQSSCSGYEQGDYILRVFVEGYFPGLYYPSGTLRFDVDFVFHFVGDILDDNPEAGDADRVDGFDYFVDGTRRSVSPHGCGTDLASHSLSFGDSVFETTLLCRDAYWQNEYAPHWEVPGESTAVHILPPEEFTQWPLPLVQVIRLEVTQGVQDWNNSLTLVRNRRTVVRAFMETATGERREITARLEGQKKSADDTTLFVDTTDPVNPGQSITVMPNVAEPERRGDIDASLNFVLPKHWTDLEADEELRLELVFDPGSNHNCEEGTRTAPTADRCVVEVEFVEVDPPGIVMVPVPVSNPDNADGTPDWPLIRHMTEQFSRIESIMPFPPLAYDSVGGETPAQVTNRSGQIVNVDFGPFPRDTNLLDISEPEPEDAEDPGNVLPGLLELQRTALREDEDDENEPELENIYLGVLTGNADTRADGNNPNGWVGAAFVGQRDSEGRQDFAHAGAWFTEGIDGGGSTDGEAHYGRFRNIGGHELGHTLGEQHPAVEDKDGQADDPDPTDEPDDFFEGECGEQTRDTVSYDFMRSVTTGEGVTEERPVLGPLDDNINTEVWGLDTRYVSRSFRGAYAFDTIYDNLAVINPYEVFSFMSYCRPVVMESQGTWMDRFHHQRIIDNYRVSESQSSSGQADAEEESASVSSDMFAGSVLLSSSGAATGVEFRPVFSWNRPPVASGDGDYVLELRDASGAAVRSVPFDAYESMAVMSSDGNALPREERRASFAVVVSDPPAYESFAVTKDGVEVGSAPRSQNAPSVSVSGPSSGDVFSNDGTISVSWVGNDADGDDLVYRVYYSTDGGATYRILSLMTEATSKSFSAMSLEGSSRARIGVSASDGTRSVFAETPIFSVAGHAPEVWIESPVAGAVFAEEQGFVLDASGYDIEDGLLAGSALSWSSSIDGSLGTGKFVVLSAADLTLGSHTITLTATDSDEMTAAASVVITIADRNMLPVANDDEAFGGLEETLQIDVLANDEDIEGDFDLSTLTIYDQPRLGIAEVSYTAQGLPVIEYSPITGGEDTFSYYICDGLYRCDTAEVIVVFPDCTITGTRDSDNLIGTSGDDVICGLDGDDFIDGKAGNDLIYAGFGEDVVAGRTGDDTIHGGPGNDLILGHRGNDTIYGGLSNDRLYGGGGDDTIWGGEETDEIYGEADNDFLYGNDGPDKIHGGQGDDIIYGGKGDDTIRGNAGTDTIYPGAGSDAVLGNTPSDNVIENAIR